MDEAVVSDGVDPVEDLGAGGLAEDGSGVVDEWDGACLDELVLVDCKRFSYFLTVGFGSVRRGLRK